MWKIKDCERPAPGEQKGTPTPKIQKLAGIVTRDAGLEKTLAHLPPYAASDLPVLVTGEPGTGKELVAEALWALSLRGHRPLQRLNCSTLMESLAGSELFGHVRGSFTDAHSSRSGKFKSAHQGTLFLDEVGDLPLSIQPRLLRAVEQGEIEALGSDSAVKVDVRLVAATNQDLPRLIAQGRFRRDLFDRLAVLVINLPPLREGGADILILAHHFLDQVAQFHQRSLAGFAPGALQRLMEHPWPGNVRELINVVTRAVLFVTGPLIQEADLIFTTPSPPLSRLPLLSPHTPPPSRPTRQGLEELLGQEGGNVSALSRRLGVCTKTIYRWLKSYRLDLANLRETGERAGQFA
jgi:DNA-binding NtrC family response regulator